MTDYHWTSALQRQFLEALAETGSVELACKDVSMSRRAAYNLRWKRTSAAFRIGWDAALLVARAVIADTLMDRAILGQRLETVRDPENHSTSRTHYDRGLGMALLNRLDRLTKGDGMDEAYAVIVRIVSQDFESFLDLIEAGGQGAEAGLFCAGRDAPEETIFPGFAEVRKNMQKDCELAQEPAADAAAEAAEITPEIAAGKMKIWWADWADGWRTDFPAPADFDGTQLGSHSNGSYSRSLTIEEEGILSEVGAAAEKPFILAGEQAREAYFADLLAYLPETDSGFIATAGDQSDTNL